MKMELYYFKHLIRQYLDEQEISSRETDSIRFLCLKAAIEGYSFSDQMLLDFLKYIPDKKEIEKYK